MTDREVFIAALERDESERAAYLAQACGPDAELRRRVDILLRAHEQASRFLAEPVLHAAGTPDSPTHTAFDSTPPIADWDVRTILSPAEKPGHLGKLDHYEVIEIVGRGGMGVVLKAFDPKLHRLVAIKVMAPHLSINVSARKRFEREARAVAAVRDEHVVAIYDVEVERPTPYLVMEFVGGVSLQDRLEQRGPLEVKEILRIGMQAACGLAAAHRLGLVHRDIKPANILLENGVERVRITDFGLARAVDDANLTQSGAITGTPNYMSPEQASGTTIDSRSDLFSLGSVLYVLCSGHPPFRAETPLAVLRRVCDDSPRPLREINADVPDWLDAIVRKLLAKNSADRFQSADEVAELLGRHLAHLQQPQLTPRPAVVAVPKVTTDNPFWAQVFAVDRTKRLMQNSLAVGGCLFAALGIVVMLDASESILLGLSFVVGGVSLLFVCRRIKQSRNGRAAKNEPVEAGPALAVRTSRLALVLTALALGILILGIAIVVSMAPDISLAYYRPYASKSGENLAASLAIWAGVITVLVVIASVLLARRPRLTNRDRHVRFAARVGLVVTLASIIVALRSFPHLHAVFFHDPKEGDLVIAVDSNRVDSIRIEREGDHFYTFNNPSMSLRVPLPPGIYTLTAFNNGKEVYREAVRMLDRARHDSAIFELPIGSHRFGELELSCLDPTVTIRLTNETQSILLHSPGGSSFIRQPLISDTHYRLIVELDGRKLHDETWIPSGTIRRQIKIGKLIEAASSVELTPTNRWSALKSTRMLLSPDQTCVAVATENGPIVVFDTATGKERFRIERLRRDASPALAFTPDGKTLAFLAEMRDKDNAFGTGTTGVKMVSVSDGTPQIELPPPRKNPLQEARALCFSADGKRLAASETYNKAFSKIFRWERDGDQWKPLSRIERHEGTIEAMRFSAKDGNLLAISRDPGTAIAWNWATSAPEHRVETSTYVDLLATSRDWDVFGGFNDVLKGPEVWLWRKGDEWRTSPNPNWTGTTRMTGLAISPNQEAIAFGTQGGGYNSPWGYRAVIRVLGQSRTAPKELTLIGHSSTIMDIAYSEGGSEITSVSLDGTLKRWRLP